MSHVYPLEKFPHRNSPVFDRSMGTRDVHGNGNNWNPAVCPYKWLPIKSGQVQARESSLVRDRRSTTEPPNQCAASIGKFLLLLKCPCLRSPFWKHWNKSVQKDIHLTRTYWYWFAEKSCSDCLNPDCIYGYEKAKNGCDICHQCAMPCKVCI